MQNNNTPSNKYNNKENVLNIFKKLMFLAILSF